MDGVGTEASFYRPQGVAVDSASNTIVVADTHNYAIRVIALESGEVTTLAKVNGETLRLWRIRWGTRTGRCGCVRKFEGAACQNSGPVLS